jgi:hypothetical protein
MLRLFEKTAEAGLQLGIGIGFGKEALGKLLCPSELPRCQSRSHGTPTSESALGIRCGQKLGNLLLEEGDVEVRCVHTGGAKILKSLGTPDRLCNEGVKKLDAHGSLGRRHRGAGSCKLHDASNSAIGDCRAADLIELIVEAASLVPFGDPADLQGDEASFGILEKPIRKLTSLKSSLHHPSQCYVHERQGYPLCSILRDPMPIELFDIAERRSNPVQTSGRSFTLDQRCQGGSWLVVVPFQAYCRSVPVLGSRQGWK